MSTFFADPPSAANPYRIFVRCADPAHGFGGTAFRRSYCLEYDSTSFEASPSNSPRARASSARQPIPQAELYQLLAHEMVHNWPMIGKRTDSDQSSKEFDWYNEGLPLHLYPYPHPIQSPRSMPTPHQA